LNLSTSTALSFPKSLLWFPLTMGVPKRKTSKMRLRTRKASHRWQAPQLNKCAQCGSPVASHTACASCGYYKGRQVLSVGT
ncbi:MAG: large subunit ribosomal protein, partial [Verrucomicrobiota bacterium]